MMIQGGQYKRNGEIIMKDGQVITAQDLIAAKKAGIPPHQLSKYLKEKSLLKEPVVEEPVKKKEGPPATEWAVVSTAEIKATKPKKKEVKVPWYKKLFKGGDE